MYSLYISKLNSNKKFMSSINIDCINFNKLVLIRPYNLYNFISLSNSNKEKLKIIRHNNDIRSNTIVFGYKKQYIEMTESSNDILTLYDIFIMKNDIDGDDILGFEKEEIDYILEGSLI